MEYIEEDENHNFGWGSVHSIDHTLPALLFNLACKKIRSNWGCFEITFEEQRYYAGIMPFSRAREIAKELIPPNDPENKILRKGLVLGEGESRIIHSRFSPAVAWGLSKILG